MCGIFSSFSKSKLIELAKLNSSRGNFSYSITAIDPTKQHLISIFKSFGNILDVLETDDPRVEWVEGAYYVCHIQAPTSATTKDARRIHPSEIEVILDNNLGSHSLTLLWHNGVLKHDYYTKSKFYDPELAWDTAVFHKEFHDDYNNISKIDGQFACLYFEPGCLAAFRNPEAPLFYDSELNVSSTKFDDSKEIEPGIFYLFDFNEKMLKEASRFECMSNSYYFE